MNKPAKVTAHTPAMSEHEYKEAKFFQTFGSVPSPGFDDPAEQSRVWGQPWGCTSDIGQLRTVLMHRPGEELGVVEDKPMPEIGGFGDPEKGWYWMGKTLPDLAAMQAAHDTLAATLRAEGVDVVLVDKAAPGAMKQIFTRDSVISVRGGAIVTRLARQVRRGEELAVTRALAAAGCPILGTVHGEGVFEGGGFALIDDKTAVCGVTVACNEEGVRQVESILNGLGIDLIKLPMPGYRIHIDGSFMMVDRETAIVNINELPYFFLDYLKKRGMRLIELPPEDNAFSLNCLAVKPGRVIMHDTRTPRLAELLDKAGIEVVAIDYEAVELGGGGIHCSTSPLARDAL
ncbi:dimethylarginine dimethylaminohydrolase family protein [Mangrovicoccus ximenensis]|uniref:dimethylarginine dimethylaminohydrolase family protein n=1 Tax=Mangrovicoccus ximenensis TaxID=1911570 RepID=UPI000D38AE75|nr:arginine deiminase family protein [Mangrovicoccus ximenensis]